MACDVTGTANSLDNNGRLVPIEQAESTREDDNDVLATYANAATFGGYSTVTPVQVSQEDYKPQVDKKRAARTAQQENGKTAQDIRSEGDGKVGKGSDGVMNDDRKACSSANDTTLMDNALYANASVPASVPAVSSPSPASASPGATDEAICTSINDFTLIDNAIYNN